MRYAAILAVLALACHQAAEEKTDTREPIAIQYVGAPELQVHKWAQDKDDNDARKGASEIRRGFEIATVNEARVK